MLMKNNFIHADCHGGNILVDVQERSPNPFSDVWDYLKFKAGQLEYWWAEITLKSQVLKKLYTENKKDQERMWRILRSCRERVVFNLIDVGMVIRLNETDRLNFINFLRCFLHNDSEKCAEMIYSLSTFDGQKIIKGKFDHYLSELQGLFSVLNHTAPEDLRSVDLLRGMMNIIRDNNMKLEGEFATLLTNMLVLEAMAKDLDKDIDILKCAVPYFKYA
jgi:aarF domain-containing kinase